MLNRFRCIRLRIVGSTIHQTVNIATNKTLNHVTRRRNFHTSPINRSNSLTDDQSTDQSNSQPVSTNATQNDVTSQNLDWHNISTKQSSNQSLNPSIVESLIRSGFSRPTEIQRMSFDPLIERQDSVIQSNTGSGKTMAYLIPIIESIKQQRIKQSIEQTDRPIVRCVIVAPTRDLCSQIQRVIESLDQAFNQSNNKAEPLSVATVTGSNDKILNNAMIDILVTNPAGLESCMKHSINQSNNQSNKSLNQSINQLFGSTDWIVFDEADQLIATNPFIERLVSELGRMKNRSINQSHNQSNDQTDTRPSLVFVAATFHAGLESATNLVNQAVTKSQNQAQNQSMDQSNNQLINQSHDHSLKFIKSVGFHRAPASIRQCWIHVEDETDRLNRLMESISTAHKRSNNQSTNQPKILVFFNSIARLENAHKAFLQQCQPDRQSNKQSNKQSNNQSDNQSNSQSNNQWSDLQLPDGVRVSLAKFHKNIPHEQRVSLVQSINESDAQSNKKSNKQPNNQPIKILFCTNIAARGVDFHNVSDVIQHDFALSAVDHLHRVGRTGRCAPSINQSNKQSNNQAHNPVQPGVVINLFDQSDHLLVSNLRSVTMEELQAERSIDQSINQTLDQSINEPVEVTAFSRKRSFRRKFKKAMKQAEIDRADHPVNE